MNERIILNPKDGSKRWIIQLRKMYKTVCTSRKFKSCSLRDNTFLKPEDFKVVSTEYIYVSQDQLVYKCIRSIFCSSQTPRPKSRTTFHGFSSYFLSFHSLCGAYIHELILSMALLFENSIKSFRYIF